MNLLVLKPTERWYERSSANDARAIRGSCPIIVGQISPLPLEYDITDFLSVDRGGGSTDLCRGITKPLRLSFPDRGSHAR